MHAQQLLQRVGGKVVVAVHAYLAHTAARSQIHGEDNQHFARRRRLAPVVHLHVEVAQPLIVVAQAAIAFVQQILVHGAFLVNGNQPLDPVGANLHALHAHPYHRPAIGREAEVGVLCLRYVLLALQLHVGLQPLLLLVVLQHAFQGAIGGVVRNLGAGLQMAAPPELRRRHAGVAADCYLAHTGLRAWRYVKVNVDKLFVGAL